MSKEILTKEIFEMYKTMIYESGAMNDAHIDYDIMQLDSLGIVKFIAQIEDKYCINLDKLLVELINVMNINELIEIVYNQIIQ